MSSALELVVSSAIVLGGVLPYVPQYLSIMRSRNSEGFSTLVCLILLIANILRILFWFGHPFETPLLVQSFLMNACMLAMMQICVATRPALVKKTFSWTELNLQSFWNWSDFQSYINFLLLFVLFSSVITFFFIGNTLYVESLGVVALLTEATLALPQLLHNWKVKSTAGMSVTMVMLWTCGDVAKTGYFVVRGAPTQFLMCGLTQILIDLLILLQVFLYKPTYRGV